MILCEVILGRLNFCAVCPRSVSLRFRMLRGGRRDGLVFGAMNSLS